MKLTPDQKKLYDDWKRLVNMSARDMKSFLKEYGSIAGLSRKEASSKGIKSGRDSARAIIRMKGKRPANWSKSDWNWARRQINFIKRFTYASIDSKKRYAMHPLIKENNKLTRYYLALLLWGHDPLKGK